MKNAVVTGAGGFIGSALVQVLLEKGVEVYAVIRRNSSGKHSFPHHPSLHIIACNMDEYASLPGLIQEDSIDVFYHLAWEGSAGPLRADTGIQLDNVTYTVEAVKAAHSMRCTRFCGAGSIMEKEADLFIPQPGVQPGKAYIYSTAKLTAHYMAKITAAALGIPFVWGIISNAFGAGEISPRFVNSTIRKFLHEDAADFTEGRQFYDFVYVTDMARAFYHLGEAGRAFTGYYIGSGHPRPLREYIEIMRDCIAPQAKLRFGAVPFNGICMPRENFDASALMADTGFLPQVSFEEGIRLTAEWLRKVEGHT